MNTTISIITVTYNAEIYLERTIQSVINQSYKNIELIIIDGKSNDKTIDIINKYKKFIHYWVSEPDRGVFDAMNKGIKASNGDWINFMNAGDFFPTDNTLSEINFEYHLGDALIYGDYYSNGILQKPFAIHSLKFGMLVSCHQAMFFNKKILNSDLHYRDDMILYNDFELVNRIWQKGLVCSYVPLPIADYMGGGVSAIVSWRARRDKYISLFRAYHIMGVIRGLLDRIGYRPYIL